MSHYGVYRMDTDSGAFELLMSMPEDKRWIKVFTEMRIAFGEMTLTTVEYTDSDAPPGDPDGYITETEKYPMERIAALPAQDITEYGSAPAEVTDRRSYDKPIVTVPAQTVSPDPGSGNYEEDTDMGEAIVLAILLISGAAVVIFFGVTAIILAVTTRKKDRRQKK